MTLAHRYGTNQKTVSKRKRRHVVTNLPIGSWKPCSTSLTLANEAGVVASVGILYCHSTTACMPYKRLSRI